jgi:hypothetical protein
MAKAERKDVVVALDPEHKKRAKKVIGQLQKKGFRLAESLTEIGLLTGSAPSDAIESLKDVEGVENVEENRTDYRPQ